MPDLRLDNGLLDLTRLPSNGKFLYVPDSQIGSPSDCQFISIADIPLFRGTPNVDDIYQTAIEDCYLIAALLAITDHPKGPKFIKQMMTRLSPYRVVVRLYHYISPTETMPIFYILDATILQHTNPSDSNCRKALWVYLVEKAYAAHRLKFGEREQPSYNDRRNQVELLEGGYSMWAFEILLGKEGQEIEVPSISMSTGANEPIQALYRVFTDPTYSSKADKLNLEQDKTLSQIFEYIPRANEMSTVEFDCAMSHAKADFIRHLNQSTRHVFRTSFNSSSIPRREALIYYINTSFANLQPITKAALYNFINANIISKRGLGNYPKSYLDFYNEIHKKIADGSLLCINTAANLRKTHQVLFLKGLQHEHSYQVINCYSRAGIIFLLIRQRSIPYTRNYEPKMKLLSKCTDGYQSPALVLSAKGNTNTPFKPVYFDKPILKPALPINNKELYELSLRDHYIFELPLEDLLKYCEFVCSAEIA